MAQYTALYQALHRLHALLEQLTGELKQRASAPASVASVTSSFSSSFDLEPGSAEGDDTIMRVHSGDPVLLPSSLNWRRRYLWRSEQGPPALQS